MTEDKKVIKEVIVVEGPTDTNKIKRAVWADTYETNGSALSKKDLTLLNKLNNKRGLIVFTDPDNSGRRIRRIISQNISPLKHAFISKQAASPKRFNHNSSLGVEHAEVKAIQMALIKAKVSNNKFFSYYIPRVQLQEDKLINHKYAKQRRIVLGNILDIGYANSKHLQHKLASFAVSKKQYIAAIMVLNDSWDKNHG